MRRIVSFLLAVVICFGLLPPALGADVPAIQKKISLSALEAMAEAADDALVPVSICLREPSEAEIEALVPVPVPGAEAAEEEIDLYAEEKARTMNLVYTGLADAFAQRYLDQTEEITARRLMYSAGIKCSVRKSRIAGLAALEEVIRITSDSETVYLLPEKTAEEKIAAPLREYMQTAADDARVPIRIWLRGRREQEAEALTAVSYPGTTATLEEIQAYRTAYAAARRQISSDPYGAFAANRLDASDEIAFQSRLIPVMIVAVPKAKIAALAGLQFVSQIDPAFYFDGVDSLPSDDPAITRKMDAYLREFLGIAAQDDRIPVSFRMKEPSNEEIEALIPVSKPGSDATQEEINAYWTAKHAAQKQVYTAITGAFVRDHLDASDEVLYTGAYTTTVTALVNKAEVVELAALEEVSSISWSVGYDDPLVPGSGEPVTMPEQAEPMKDPAVYAKVAPYLFGYMKNLPNGEEIPVSIRLNCPAQADVAERLSAFAAAYLNDGERIIFKGKTSPEIRAVVTKAKIGTLAAADEVASIEWTDSEHVHAYTDVVTAPTCTEAGCTTHTCDCGDAYRDTEALGHDYKDGVCVRCGAGDPDDAPPVAALFRFDDVKDDQQFYFAPVYWAVEKKITTGTSEKLFSPDAGCTRAQVVTFLWRAADEPEPETANPFQDVQENDYYYKAVLWAVGQGITTGTSADRFSPDAACTRAQIVTFLYRAEGEPERSGKENPFKDVSGDEYFADAVLWAVEKGITKGTSADRFSPEKTCTRGEIVTFLHRDQK